MVKKGKNSLRGKDIRDRDNFRKVDELQNMIGTDNCCHIQFIEKKKSHLKAGFLILEQRAAPLLGRGRKISAGLVGRRR